MRIILKSLALDNFKNLTGEWKFKNGINTILGKNGTGKTTLDDAQEWLRTGKDSLGSAKFDIKTIVNGVPVSKANHGVISIYEVDGETLTFERIYSEKWAKTRGKLENELTGHTTTYRLNGKANTTKRAFDAKVAEVFGGEQFTLVTDPLYFANLHWEKRRAILGEMCGEIDKKEIIKSIKGLGKFLEGMTVEEMIEVYTENKRSINKEIGVIPDLIKENQSKISEVDDVVSIEEAENNLLASKTAIEAARKAIEDHKNSQGAEEADKLQGLSQKLRVETSRFEEEKTTAQISTNKTSSRLLEVEDTIKSKIKAVGHYTKLMESERALWWETRKTSFTEKGNACSYCGEVIACPHCDEKDDDALKNFNRKKALELAKIGVSGKILEADKVECEKEIIELEKESEKLKSVGRPGILDLSGTESMTNLRNEIAKLGEVKTNTEIPPRLTDDLKRLGIELEKSHEVLARSRSSVKTRARIQDLEKRMTKLSEEFCVAENFLSLAGEYNKKLASSTEERVNKMFDYVKFRMFDTQVNGSIFPTCDILNNESRPYETALSNGERIRAGLDIIKTMSGHFDILAPVFIDNAESITDFPKLDCQLIMLCVSVSENELKQI